MGSEEVGAEGSGKRGAGGRQRSGVGEGLTGAGAPEEVQGRKAPVARPAALPPNRPAMKRLWKAAGVAEDRDFINWGQFNSECIRSTHFHMPQSHFWCPESLYIVPAAFPIGQGPRKASLRGLNPKCWFYLHQILNN